MESVSLYEKYGGFATISLIVYDFYARINQSPTLEPFFGRVDMDRLIRHQIAFLCKVTGGPDNYDGRALETAHAKVGVTHAAFDEVAGLLQESLEQGGMEPRDVTTVMGVVASYAELIITTGPRLGPQRTRIET